MSRCKFTIITVCYNAECHIEETIKSVLSQSYREFEYIIKDGQSADRTMELAHSLTDKDNRAIIIQGKDKGIYDAMNIAVSQAVGEYILFLNAGDKFVDEHVLQKVSDYILQEDIDILYGDVIEVGQERSRLRTYTEKNCKMWYYSLGACLCHQAMFCKRKLFREKLFNLQYKVCADREWQMYHLKKGAKAKPLKLAVAEVLVEGFSTAHVTDLEKETYRCVKNYCGGWSLVYRLLFFLKKNKILYSIIQKTEKMISCK